MYVMDMVIGSIIYRYFRQHAVRIIGDCMISRIIIASFYGNDREQGSAQTLTQIPT